MVIWSILKFILLTSTTNIYYAPDWLEQRVIDLELASGIVKHVDVFYDSSEYNSARSNPWYNYVVVSQRTLDICANTEKPYDCLDGVISHELGHIVAYNGTGITKLDEYLADIDSIFIMNNAKKDPCGVKYYLETLIPYDMPNNTHPLSRDRVEVIERMCKEVKNAKK